MQASDSLKYWLSKMSKISRGSNSGYSNSYEFYKSLRQVSWGGRGGGGGEGGGSLVSIEAMLIAGSPILENPARYTVKRI